MKNKFGEEIDYRPVYRNGRFDAVPYGENDYCLVKKDTQGVFAAGRVFSNENAFAVSDIIGSIYQKAIFDCCERIERHFGQAGREMTNILKLELCKGFGLPQELSKEDTAQVLKEIG